MDAKRPMSSKTAILLRIKIKESSQIAANLCAIRVFWEDRVSIFGDPKTSVTKADIDLQTAASYYTSLTLRYWRKLEALDKETD